MELEYKYVIKNPDGGILCWKPGSNYQLRVPVFLEQDKAVTDGVWVKDAWDGSNQDVELQVTGLPASSHRFTADEELAAVQSAVCELAGS